MGAKGNTAAFEGGKSVIFAGDSVQLPPTGDVHLYTYVQECRYKRVYGSGELGASEGAREVAYYTVSHSFTQALRRQAETSSMAELTWFETGSRSWALYLISATTHCSSHQEGVFGLAQENRVVGRRGLPAGSRFGAQVLKVVNL